MPHIERTAEHKRRVKQLVVKAIRAAGGDLKAAAAASGFSRAYICALVKQYDLQAMVDKARARAGRGWTARPERRVTDDLTRER